MIYVLPVSYILPCVQLVLNPSIICFIIIFHVICSSVVLAVHMEVMEVILQDEVARGKYCLFFVVLSNVPELGLVVCFSSLFLVLTTDCSLLVPWGERSFKYLVECKFWELLFACHGFSSTITETF